MVAWGQSMNCAGCGLEIQGGFAFCPKCGMRQPKSCLGCGYPCPSDFAFCPKCGAPTNDAGAEGKPTSRAASALTVKIKQPALPAVDADRRTITILFADLSGFTALSEQIDPELMQALQNELFEELTEAVQSFGGFVDKFIGDALLALFGAPIAHEEDPERALRAALDMVERASRMGERWQARAGAPPILHIGVNTGPVVTGGFGAGSAKSYSVTGDTVNTAQRLQSMASPSEVLVGPLTQRLTRHAFVFETLGETMLRGKTGSIPVYRLKGLREAARPARGLEALGLSTPLIGRKAELERMFASLDLACRGSAQLVRLVGEAGIGKSRLVNEFIARIGDEQRFAAVAIRQAACSPLGEQSYGTLAAVVRSAAGMRQGGPVAETKARLSDLLGELGLNGDEAVSLTPLLLHVVGLGGPDGVLRHVQPEQLRRQIFFAIRTIFERRLALGPLLIVVEDLHWADAVSLEALRFLMDRLERQRLIMVFTHRPTFDMEQLDSRRISHTTLRLAPLDDNGGRKLLASLFGEKWDQTLNSLGSRILDRAGGNPLFIEEIVRGFIEGGILERDGLHWRAASSEAAVEIPASIQAILLARADRLPPEARRLAQEAAVLGPRFDATLLAAISAHPKKIETGLDILCDAEIIEEVAAGGSIASRSYRFTQALLQNVIYQNLLLQRRTEMHGQVGMALEQSCGQDPERLEDLLLLGHHFSLSPNRAKGARYLRSAGDRARAVYANDDAIRHYQQALTALADDPEPVELRLSLRERIADLCGTTGRREAAHEHYRTVLVARRATGDRAGAARILRKLGRLLWQAGKRTHAEAHYAEAALLLEGTDARIEQALLLQERGRLAFRIGEHSNAIKWAEKALEQAESLPVDADEGTRLEAAHATAEALNTKGVALARLERCREAVIEVEQSVNVAEAAGLLSAACRGYTNLGVLYTVIDPARAIQVCRRGLEVARRIGDLGFQARLLANLAVVSCTFTDRCGGEGVPAAEKAIELDRALDEREHLPVPLIVLGQIHQCHGEPELAARCYNEALEVARETGEPQMLFPCYDGLATLSLDVGDMAEAERYFSLAQDVCNQHGLNPEGLVVLPFLD
ncbi:adenylate cyclase [Sinorhizobium medicae]